MVSKGVGVGDIGDWFFYNDMNFYLSRISLAEGFFVAKIRCSLFLKKIKKKFFNLSFSIHGD